MQYMKFLREHQRALEELGLKDGHHSKAEMADIVSHLSCGVLAAIANDELIGACGMWVDGWVETVENELMNRTVNDILLEEEL